MKKRLCFSMVVCITIFVFLNQALANTSQFQAQQMVGIFKYPSDIVVIPEQNKAYVSNQTGGVISIIDLSMAPPTISSQIVIQASSAIKLIRLAYNKAYEELYALDWANSQLYIVDTKTNKLINSSIIVGGYPQNLMVSEDGQTIFVCANQKDEIVMIDSMSKNITSRIFIGEDADPFGMAIVNSKLYVTGRFSNKLHIIDIAKQIEINRIKVTQSPFDIIARPDGRFMYVSHDIPSGEISIIDTQTDAYVSTIQMRDGDDSIYKNAKDLLIDENKLYVVNFGDQSISVIDTHLNQKIDLCHPIYTGADYPEQMALSSNGQRLYIVHPINDVITMLDLPPEKPSFRGGTDIQIKNCDGIQTIPNWATQIQTGQNTTAEFQCKTNNEAFFSRLPEISTDGTLSFMPSVSAEGTARVDVILIRNSDALPGNCNTSDKQSFFIKVTSCDPTLHLIKAGNGEVVINKTTRVLPPYSQQFSEDEKVELLARPYNENWLFSHWLIDNVQYTVNPMIIDIQKNIRLKAIFIENQSVQLHIDGNCSVSVNGKRHDLPWNNLFVAGNAITLFVSEYFSHWSGDISGNEMPLIIKIGKDMNIMAHCHSNDSRQYYLKKGFNLVSLSLIPENSSLLANFPQAKVAYAYENGGYVRGLALEPGKGYWIEMPSTRTIEIAGYPFTSNQLQLKRGWQLIGGIHKPAKIQTIPENCVQTIYGYNEGGYQQTTEILSEKGYWIYLEQDCTVSLLSIE